jgi:hypothetical protein
MQTPSHGTPRTPVMQAAQALGRLFTEHASPAATHSASPASADTPGQITAVKDPTNQRINDIHIFTKGLTTYRGDNSFKPGQATHYSAQFFTFERQVAQNQYGKLVLKFKLQKDIQVLRLDKNAEGFHHWLKNTNRFSQSEKDILYENFGYPKNSSANDGATELPRARVSQGGQDRTMLKMIHYYAQETGQEIDGYYNSTMPNGTLGNLKTEDGKAPLFHAELAVFDGSVFSQPKMANNLNSDKLEALNLEAKRIRLETEDRLARQSKKQRPS